MWGNEEISCPTGTFFDPLEQACTRTEACQQECPHHYKDASQCGLIENDLSADCRRVWAYIAKHFADDSPKLIKLMHNV